MTDKEALIAAAEVQRLESVSGHGFRLCIWWLIFYMAMGVLRESNWRFGVCALFGIILMVYFYRIDSRKMKISQQLQDHLGT